MKQAKTCRWHLFLFLVLAFSGFSCTSETIAHSEAVTSNVTTTTAMKVSHPTKKFYDCLKCHNSGREEAAPPDHMDYMNDDCLTCHAPE